MKHYKKELISWLVLIALTLLSVYVGEIIPVTSIFLFVVLAIVFVKGQQITDIFMELKHAPRLWRNLLLAYVFLIPLIIFAIYII